MFVWSAIGSMTSCRLSKVLDATAVKDLLHGASGQSNAGDVPFRVLPQREHVNPLQNQLLN
jgi:hypothetical protein